MRPRKPTFNPKKFKEVILYILNKTGGLDEEVLKTLLYFIDFDHYERYEEHLMGATYIKDEKDSDLLSSKLHEESEAKKIMRKDILTDEEKKKIIKLLKEKKHSIREIATRVKKSPSTVSRLASTNEIELINPPPKKLLTKERDKIINLLKEKRNGNEVARIVKRAPITILRIARQHKIKLRIRNKKPNIR